ncbi:ankyrin repeat domain-containing protein [Granulicella sp. S156]|uniref:ankyrin repeat domain-containing protein n=1 Tax=Granulicella sp. S156 TaxID=1747224 RepID=UPI00131B2F6D|nr:ankyrin repeat domain-containing protein [Granulicella sp. S156]
MSLSYRGAQTLIKRGDEPALRTALDQGLDANLANHKGWSLLMLAAVEGSVPLGQLLIEKGANLVALNGKGDTPLSIATQKGHTAFIELLREHSA